MKRKGNRPRRKEIEGVAENKENQADRIHERKGGKAVDGRPGKEKGKGGSWGLVVGSWGKEKRKSSRRGKEKEGRQKEGYDIYRN
ncbi:MAG: hypothetical protein WCX65_10695 [bacterium]